MPDNNKPVRFRIDIRSDEYGKFYVAFLGSDIAGVPDSEVLSALTGIAYNLSCAPRGMVPIYVAPPVLPQGWEETLDGVGAGTDGPSRTYIREGVEFPVTAPCAPDGSVIDATVALLRGYDLEFPFTAPKVPDMPEA